MLEIHAPRYLGSHESKEMRKTLLILMMLASALLARADKLLQTLYTRQVLEKTIVAPGAFSPVPKSTSPFWKQTLSQQMVGNYVDNAKKYLHKSWTPLPQELFSEYSRNGNRTNYEKRSFALRHQMASLVIAEILQDNGVFVDDIIKGLHYFISETWWGIPAHYPKPQPEASLQEVDLFNAETANLLAWTCYMLENSIRKRDATICETVKKEIQRRMLEPAHKNNYTWKVKSWNHNPWTCSNWLSCILFCEDNRQRQIDDICQVLKALDIFIDGYSEDGGCDEGPMYWDRAAASLFECMQLLSLASGGQVSLPLTDKIKAMGAYICRMYAGSDMFVTFSASPLRIVPNIHILYPFGVAIGNSEMTRFAAYIAQKNKYFEQPSVLFNRSGNLPALSRELCFLRLLSKFMDETAQEPSTEWCWMKDVEVFIARNSNNGNKGFFVAAKGGNNDENHNHNDIGNFVVYADGEPLFIDLGNDTYTAKTFSKERYTLMNTRSAFHNVPLINQQEQQAGNTFRSKSIKCQQSNSSKLFSIDLMQAYPNTAQVKKWRRDLELTADRLTITENYQLKAVSSPTQLMFMSRYAPVLNEEGAISYKLPKGTYELRYDPSQMKAETESFDISKTGMQPSWGNTVYRTKLTIVSGKKKNKIKYTISKK